MSKRSTFLTFSLFQLSDLEKNPLEIIFYHPNQVREKLNKERGEEIFVTKRKRGRIGKERLERERERERILST